MLKSLFISAAALGAMASLPVTALAQTEESYLGDVMVVGFDFCPRGWMSAEGQILSIASNTALFSLIGTTYGGDGRTSFALPDLRGRVPIHHGQGNGLPYHSVGASFGTESVTLTQANLAEHRHTVMAAGDDSANQPSPENHSFPSFPAGQLRYAADSIPTKAMDSDMVTHTGEGQPVSIIAPSAVLRYCIATQGIFPPRD